MKYIILSISLFLVSCSKKNDTSSPQLISCQIIKEVDGTYLVCPDGSKTIVASNGYNSLIKTLDHAPVCENDGIVVLAGQDKNRNNTLDQEEIDNTEVVCNGIAGTNGVSGHSVLISTMPAVSCNAGGIILFMGTDLDDNGILNSIEVAVTSTICNGIPGIDGVDGISPTFTSIDIIDPCGDSAGIIDEIFIKMPSGQFIGSISDNSSGKNTRFSILMPGSYITKDGSKCHFTIDSNDDIINEHF